MHKRNQSFSFSDSFQSRFNEYHSDGHEDLPSDLSLPWEIATRNQVVNGHFNGCAKTNDIPTGP